MNIHCTKKLYDFLKIKPGKVTVQTDPLFSWSANLILLNRRKTLVVVNNATRIAFVLYGITSKDINNFSKLIKEGIRAVFESEYISPEIIEKYLEDCGSEILLVSGSNRSDTAYCNKACERVQRFTYIFENGDMFEKKYLPWINYDLIGKEDYTYINTLLINALTEKYGSPVQSARVAELEVTLNLMTKCKRTLIVPDNLNFYQLHNVLQNTFEWQDEHMHQFVTKINKRGVPLEIVRPDTMDDFDTFEPCNTINSTSVTVSEIFSRYKMIGYIYDFGDGWEHSIKLKRFIENFNDPYPHCTKAIGDAPMEDSGGPYGFFEKMKILENPKHPEYEWISDWVKSSWWHHVDIDLINRRLTRVHHECVPVYYD